MSRYFLRAEGVNLSEIIDDSQDLSTIRGSSFMLLGVIDAIGELLKNAAKLKGGIRLDKVQTITSGASVGVFAFKATDLKTAELARDLVEDHLTGKKNAVAGAVNGKAGQALALAHHGTFVVDVVAQQSEFKQTLEMLLAKNRWRQMQDYRTPFEPRGKSGDTPGAVCEFNMVSSAHGTRTKLGSGEKLPISCSVDERRGFGVTQKHRHYEEELARLKESRKKTPQLTEAICLKGFPLPSLDFHALAAGAPLKRLSGKMAVLYVDGNEFGKTQAKFVHGGNGAPLSHETAEQRQEEFDETVKGYRRDLLNRILCLLDGLAVKTTASSSEFVALAQKADDEKALYTSYSKAAQFAPFDATRTLRFETLLWGGDEMMWVMPAAAGWRVAELFFHTVLGDERSAVAASARLQELGAPEELPKSERWKIDTKELSFGAGLVFCHHNADITRITALAKEIADLAKAEDKERNLLAYQVLESFDFLGRDARRVFEERAPKGLSFGHHFIPGEMLSNLRQTAVRLEQIRLPQRRIKTIAQYLQHAGINDDRFIQAVERAHDEIPKLEETITPLYNALGWNSSAGFTHPAVGAAWAHLDLLWDYLAIELVEPPASNGARLSGGNA